MKLLLLLCCMAAGSAHAGNPIRGAELYGKHCAVCHGANGRPVLPGAPDFSSPTALLKGDLALLATIRTGKGVMPAFAGLLRDGEILDVVSHLRTLR